VLMALLARQQQPRSKVSRHGSCWHQLQYHHTARQAPDVCLFAAHLPPQRRHPLRAVPAFNAGLSNSVAVMSVCRTGAAGVRWRNSSSSGADAASITAAAEAPAWVRQPAWGPAMPPGQEDHLLLRQPAYVAALPAPPRLSEECRREEMQGERWWQRLDAKQESAHLVACRGNA
jgi:hypothetical protein